MTRTTGTCSRSLYGAAASPADQRTAFTSGQIPVAVYGLGKMGLPLASVYADVCGNVTGVDVDETVCELVNAGDCHVDREPGLDALVASLVERGSLSAVTDPIEAARAAAVHVVIVPTVLTDDRRPDLSTLRSVVGDIATGLSPGDLVVVESTVPPGACSTVVRPLLESVSGLQVGEFGLAFCPERTSSGRALADIRGSHPKVVGGLDEESTRAAALVYDELTDNEVLTVSDATTAEAVKVFEGLYRDVNIALANQLAHLTDELGIDVTEAIETANTQPYCDIHTPGAGVGGHCIPFYPYFVLGWLDTAAPLLRTAREVNDGMPAFAVEKVVDGLASAGRPIDDSTVLVLGLTYRAGVAETRASPALDICERLDALGADVLATDPMLDDASEFAATPIGLDEIADYPVDAAVLVTAHEEFQAIDWTAFDRSLVVVDGRDALSLDETDHRVYTIGRGAQ